MLPCPSLRASSPAPPPIEPCPSIDYLSTIVFHSFCTAYSQLLSLVLAFEALPLCLFSLLRLPALRPNMLALASASGHRAGQGSTVCWVRMPRCILLVFPPVTLLAEQQAPGRLFLSTLPMPVIPSRQAETLLSLSKSLL